MWCILSLRRKQIPGGLRDYLPEELARRRALERRITEVFNRWGYREVVTPTFEFVDVLESQTGYALKGSTYRFFDPDGELVALRPEMTTPIARLVSTRMRTELDPGRFWYLANVFRYADPEVGHRREFYQAGVEIIGSGSVFADAGSIALCIDCLDGCGLRGFGIDIGHMGFVNGLMRDIGLEDRVSSAVKAALLRQDLVGLKSIVGELGLSKRDNERLLALGDLRGDESILVAGADIAGNSEQALSALDDLKKVVSRLRSLGAMGPVSIDLGLVKNFDYYTGVIFQGHAFGVGYDICGGGRYDNLLAQFGYDSPSTGFAIGIERVLAAVEQGNPDLLNEPRTVSGVVTFEESLEPVALADTKRLRQSGIVVEVELDARPLDTIFERAVRIGRSFVLSYSRGTDGLRCDVFVRGENREQIASRLREVLPSRRFFLSCLETDHTER